MQQASNQTTHQPLLGKNRPTILLASDAEPLDIINEIHVKIDQAKGILSLLCDVDLSDRGNLVDNAVANSAWKLGDELDTILALVNALDEATRVTPGEAS